MRVHAYGCIVAQKRAIFVTYPTHSYINIVYKYMTCFNIIVFYTAVCSRKQQRNEYQLKQRKEKQSIPFDMISDTQRIENTIDLRRNKEGKLKANQQQRTITHMRSNSDVMQFKKCKIFLAERERENIDAQYCDKPSELFTGDL